MYDDAIMNHACQHIRQRRAQPRETRGALCYRLTSAAPNKTKSKAKATNKTKSKSKATNKSKSKAKATNKSKTNVRGRTDREPWTHTTVDVLLLVVDPGERGIAVAVRAPYAAKGRGVERVGVKRSLFGRVCSSEALFSRVKHADKMHWRSVHGRLIDTGVDVVRVWEDLPLGGHLAWRRRRGWCWVGKAADFECVGVPMPWPPRVHHCANRVLVWTVWKAAARRDPAWVVWGGDVPWCRRRAPVSNRR